MDFATVWDWLWSKPGSRNRGREKKKAFVLSLQPGDAVSYEGKDYLVESRYSYSAGGFSWFDYLLFDAATKERIWLSAEDDDGLKLAIYRIVKNWVIPSSIGQTVSFHRDTYSLLEHGQANVVIQGPDEKKDTTVEYWDFQAADSKLLGIERWGGEFETSQGVSIENYELEIYPAGHGA
ncbi:MAG TPA: DUF4178 domain-containing protein [Chroococcales cyanobacterium]|jgi:hypothetical protein